ncbi:MAG: hypothetical protein AAGA48_00870 [Myxococcota bacterium]
MASSDWNSTLQPSDVHHLPWGNQQRADLLGLTDRLPTDVSAPVSPFEPPVSAAHDPEAWIAAALFNTNDAVWRTLLLPGTPVLGTGGVTGLLEARRLALTRCWLAQAGPAHPTQTMALRLAACGRAVRALANRLQPGAATLATEMVDRSPSGLTGPGAGEPSRWLAAVIERWMGPLALPVATSETTDAHCLVDAALARSKRPYGRAELQRTIRTLRIRHAASIEVLRHTIGASLPAAFTVLQTLDASTTWVLENYEQIRPNRAFTHLKKAHRLAMAGISTLVSGTIPRHGAVPTTQGPPASDLLQQVADGEPPETWLEATYPRDSVATRLLRSAGWLQLGKPEQARVEIGNPLAAPYEGITAAAASLTLVAALQQSDQSDAARDAHRQARRHCTKGAAATLLGANDSAHCLSKFST